MKAFLFWLLLFTTGAHGAEVPHSSTNPADNLEFYDADTNVKWDVPDVPENAFIVASTDMYKAEYRIQAEARPQFYYTLQVFGQSEKLIMYVDGDGDIFLHGKWIGYDGQLPIILNGMTCR